MRITPHFSLAEFDCRDGTPYPAEWIDARLHALCELLEVIRGRVNRPLRILSGYRTLRHNRAIGSKDTSQHVQGRAADIAVDGVLVADVHAAILALYEDGTLRERPTRLGGLGFYPRGGFVHVDTRPGKRLVRWGGSRVET